MREGIKGRGVRIGLRLNEAENTVKDTMMTKTVAVLLWLFDKDYGAHIHSES